MIKKIISGGQTGADQGGLDFALEYGIEAGGWCPKGRICENGVIPARYPVEEVEEDDYNLRTKQNVRDSDGTLLIIRDGLMEEGTHLTIDFCRDFSKPWFLVDLKVMSGQLESIYSALADWTDKNRISVLNVAGNRESNSPGIQEETAALLARFLADLTGQPDSEG
ncbi:MAG: putative molybdenum carrier protein [Bacteroidales bacterium]|nr:putative molybdenum carrier protein [Bacteroidales bacterium]